MRKKLGEAMIKSRIRFERLISENEALESHKLLRKTLILLLCDLEIKRFKFIEKLYNKFEVNLGEFRAKGRIQVKKLKAKAAFYTAQGYDETYGGEFANFIEPFSDAHSKGYFYHVRQLDNGKMEVIGHTYIVTDKNSLKHHKKRARKRLNGEYPMYYWLDGNGRVIKKTYI